jgi:signal transduction histidine kinase
MRARWAIVHGIPLLGLAALVAAVFAALVVVLGRLPKDEEAGWLAVSMLAAAVSALLYASLRPGLGRFAKRLAYGARVPSVDRLDAFAAGMTRAVPLSELLLQLTESLRSGLALEAAEVWTGPAGALERRASDPDLGSASLRLDPPVIRLLARGAVSGRSWLGVWLPSLLAGRGTGDMRVAPIVEAGELLGLILVSRPGGGEPFSRADEDALARLGRRLGLALRNAMLDSELRSSLDELSRQSEELRRSRARVVAAADAERQRIERDLHDGAQQHFVSLAVKSRLARDLITTDPATAQSVLGEVSEELHEALEQLRDLARGIYPPLLLDRGLGDALHAAIQRRSPRGRVEADASRRYPADLETTVYFCCLEALQNVDKHAGPGAHVTIRIWEEQSGLHFEVVDDGTGFGSEASAGAGLANMHDRIGAIGGSLVVESSAGQGTRVQGAIPLGAEPR